MDVISAHRHLVSNPDSRGMIQPNFVILDDPALPVGALNCSGLRGISVLLDNESANTDIACRAIERIYGHACLELVPGRVVREVDLGGAVVEVPLAGNHIAQRGGMLKRDVVNKEVFGVTTPWESRKAKAAGPSLLGLAGRYPVASFSLKGSKEFRPAEDRPKLSDERISVLGSHTLQTMNTGLEKERRARRIAVHCALDVVARTADNRPSRRCRRGIFYDTYIINTAGQQQDGEYHRHDPRNYPTDSPASGSVSAPRNSAEVDKRFQQMTGQESILLITAMLRRSAREPAGRRFRT
jgi:hypothetical protein